MNEQALSTSQNYSIAELRTRVKAGQLRVPQFQRSFRWERRDVLNLVDSVLRGYPIGSLLLWKREAEAERLRIGALDVDARQMPDALWVVDGQQRITSLVNVVDPVGAQDPRFALGYSLEEKKVVLPRDPGQPLVIPLPDLFDLGRALAWLGANPDGAEFASHIQEVTGRLAGVSVPATIMEDADEQILREVFDRINNRGKRLNAAEIFDAIHGGPDTDLTTSGISAHIDERTHFGVLADTVVVQALLVRRHTDITRDVHGEFSSSRRAVSDFPDEGKGEAYIATERALMAAVRFLQEQCGVPHMTFLPFRFQLLVLARFFAFFPTARSRNLELLRRWFWRTSVGADELGISGSQNDLRDMAACLIPGQESESIQRLLHKASLKDAQKVPDLRVFRATRSDSKVILAAMWNRGPVDPDTGEPMTVEALAAQLEDETTPRAVVADLVPPSALGEDAAVAANKVVSALDRRDLFSSLTDDSDLDSLLLNTDILRLLQHNDYEEAIRARGEVLHEYLTGFIRARTACGHEDTPPLDDFVFDDAAEGEKS
jgi:hypothetical protein avisC_06013